MFPRTISRTVSAAVAVVATFSLSPAFAGPIKDVPAGSKIMPAIISVTSKKLMDAPGGQFNGDKAVTRYELAVTLDRLVKYIENGRKPMHPTKRQHSVQLPSGAPPQVRGALKHLTDYYFIDTNSILLKGKGTEVVTAKQLSSILSQVTVRISDRAVAPQPD